MKKFLLALGISVSIVSIAFAQFHSGTLMVTPNNPSSSVTVGPLTFTAKVQNAGVMKVNGSDVPSMTGCTVYVGNKFMGNIDISTRNGAVTRSVEGKWAITMQISEVVNATGTYMGSANAKLVTSISIRFIVNRN